MRISRDPKLHIPAALRYRDFALLWIGQTVSMAGNGVFTVALPLEVLRLTSSSLNLALIISARTIPAVLLLLAGGTVVDRTSRRLVMLASEAICGVSVGLAAILIAIGNVRLWELAALSAVFGIASAFFKPATTAIPPDVLPPKLLTSASSLSSLSESIAQYMLGTLGGGLIVAAIGTAWAFGLDAITFAFSVGCLAAMHHTAKPAASGSALREGIREGLGYCRSQPWLWWSMIAVGIANLACYMPLTLLEPLLVKHVFHAGPVALGCIYSASGAGSALASIYAARRPMPQRRLGAIWVAWSGSGLAAVALGLAPWLWMAIVSAGLVWFGITYGNVRWYPLMQEEVPPHLLGRASSVDWLLSLALAPAGTVAGGAVAAVAGVRQTLIIGGLLATATGSVLLIPNVTAPDHRRAAGCGSSTAPRSGNHSPAEAHAVPAQPATSRENQGL